MDFTVLMAFKNGTLETLINNKVDEFMAKWPEWNVTTAIGMAAAYYGKIGMVENEALTMEARRSSTEIDNLFWWLKEDATSNVLGYLAQHNRSLLADIREYDAKMAELEAFDWSQKARYQRMTEPTRRIMTKYHEDRLSKNK